MDSMKTITVADAEAAHPGAHIKVIDRSDSEGCAHPAIYVWETEAESEYCDGSGCIEIYWMGRIYVAPTITNSQIREARKWAGVAGDWDMVDLCDLALSGDDDARDQCAETRAAGMES